jgi:hypothetical protein
MRLLGKDIEIVDVLITTVMKNTDQDRLEKAAAASDFIAGQLILPTFRLKFLQTAFLKERYGEDRVLVWPNIFFKGQTPDLFYVTTTDGARILGPLSEYHSRPVLGAWMAGLDVDQTETLLTTGRPNLGWLPGIAEASFVELNWRERGCSVRVSPAIKRNWRSQRYFFTFNHPTNSLMAEVAKELLALMGQPAPSQEVAMTEQLAYFMPPSWPAVVEQLGLEFPTSTTSKGVQMDLSNGSVSLRQIATSYTSRELIDAYFRAYDVQRHLFAGCRFT